MHVCHIPAIQPEQLLDNKILTYEDGHEE